MSTEEQAKGQSIDNQVYFLRKYAESQGWNVVGVYRDKGYSGGNEERPGLRALMRDAKSARVEVVSAMSTDRLARNLELAFTMMRRLFGYGVKLYFVNHSQLGLMDAASLDNPNILMPLRIFTMMDENQRIVTKWKTLQVMQKMKEEGRKLGKPFTGFKYHRKTGAMMLDGPLAPLVLSAHNAGSPPSKIARLVQDRLGIEFDRFKVHRILDAMSRYPQLRELASQPSRPPSPG